MASLAWLHRQKIEKQKASEKAKANLIDSEKSALEDMAKDNAQYNLLVQGMDNELKALSNVPSGSARLPEKERLIKIYMPFVDAYLNAKEVYVNIILTQCLIWLFDLGRIVDALALAKIAIEQKQPMPKRFKSTLKAFIAREVVQWAKKIYDSKEETSAEPYFSEMMEQVLEWDIHEQIKIEYLKLAAKFAIKKNELEEALALYKRAVEINPDFAKCKTAIKDLEKSIAKAKEA